MKTKYYKLFMPGSFKCKVRWPVSISPKIVIRLSRELKLTLASMRQALFRARNSYFFPWPNEITIFILRWAGL